MTSVLRNFQAEFGRHLRDPHHTPRPAGLSARRTAVYGELLFNNLNGFLDTCFPVCRAVLGEFRWRRLHRAFFRDWRSPTPWFREIPREFVRYLQASLCRQPLPGWFVELAHYEWAELAVDVMEAPLPPHDPAGDLADGRPVLNPALLNLRYTWPVHRIGTDYRPRQPQATHLLVFRDAALHVQFIEINPVTARLLTLLADGRLSGQAACLQIAEELQHPAPEALCRHGLATLAELRLQGALLGTSR